MFRGKVILSALALLVLFQATTAAGFDLTSVDGPKTKDLYMVIYRDPDSQMLALQKGEIDVLGDITRPVDIDRLSNFPGVSLSISRAFHLFFMGFNLRIEPWNDITLRQAVSMSIPSRQIVRDIFSGYSEPVSTYLPPVSPYYEGSVKTWDHDPSGARKLLEEAGWKWNPEGTLVPPGKTSPLEPVRLLSPTAQVAPTSAEVAGRIAEAMKALGVPVSLEPLDFSMMIKRLDSHDFDLFIMAWSLTRDPDSLFAFFHSSMDVPGGYNIQGLHDDALDRVLEELRWAPDRETAEKAASKSQIMLSEIAPWVPIYSRYMVTAVREGWKGIIGTERTTADNIWTLINMEPEKGSERPVMWCLQEEPRSLNPFSTSSVYDWQVLGLVYDSLLSIDPENLEDIPWLARSWKVETTGSESNAKTRLSFVLRDGVKWHDGVPLTSRDVKESLEFLKSREIPRYYDSVRDIESVETPDERTVIVNMSNTSFWHLHNIGGSPVFPAHILESVKDWESWQPSREKHPSVEGLTMLVGTGPFIFREYRPGEYVHFTRYDNFSLPWRD